ncbi:MAG TPA: 50S ribosomal protein L6 [Anaerohalosphaeraceae bacterium]|nr:50S ribosomal protein L6 [Anaerohalosphaeraceae bacterium]HOL31088.1 50S ribosomal protein L6 [Anaerohalosphaeraceae bacterium]HOM76175.1 50S ribosomal protein L6 [Anaerohalosphaeraceae bacterium]HPC64662.1 50S ribosomal protein L6 [Anaerohalosphaeraceae bacterium]HPO69786.1 50S ribosomal protein L6 [Anaerohalosphaeraceae bacterium]
MSRIGKKPIAIPAGVSVEQKGCTIKISGPRGTLERQIQPDIQVTVDGKQIVVSNPDSASRFKKALHGTVRAHLNNMVIGVSKGFEKAMQIYGTGYNVKEQGGKLVLSVGYCHPVELPIPKGVKVDIKTPATRGNDVPALFTLTSADKQLLGQFAAEIRKVRPPEPYQGKGIRYADEHVIRKEGKALGT